MNEIIENLKLAISVLTRIPIMSVDMEKASWPKSCAFFPVCGYIVAIPTVIIPFVIWHFNNGFPPLLLAAWSVFSLIFVTGAMHLDGLADICDGFGCHADKNKRLEIMHDPRVGTFGIAGLIILILFKFAAFYIIYQNSYFYQAFSVIVLSRTLLTVSAYYAKPLENKGLGALILQKIDNKTLLIALILTIPFVCINIFAIIFMCLITLLVISKSYNLLDGVNGDVIGAVCEISEAVGLFSIAVLIYF